MPQSEPQSSSLSESYDEIPAIDDDDSGESEMTSNFCSRFKNQFFFTVVVKDEQPSIQGNVSGAKSMDSINSYEGGRLGLIDGEQVEDEEVEKARLITQVLELQNTLDDLNQRVDAVKFENLKLKSENQVLGQYIGELWCY